jgi:hypothetical protein
MGRALLAVSEQNLAESFEVFSRTLDIEWVKEALQATGTATVRRRKMPAEFAVWMVIGMALLRDRSIDEVVHHLRLVLPKADLPATIAHSSTSEARSRLGCAALALLFVQSAKKWAHTSADALRWRGLAVYGLDGTTLSVADTAENAQAFGRPTNASGGGAYPQLRLVVLMVLRSHLLANFSAGPFNMSEPALAKKLWDDLPDDALVVFDKGHINYGLFWQIQHRGSHRNWLCAARSNLKWRVIRALGKGDDLIEIRTTAHQRHADPNLPDLIVARAITYQRPGFRPRVLLTSLIDSDTYPANEIIELYHERWELELGFDELKTHTLERTETLRSKIPERICQELWGLAIAYNLVRLEMLRVAERLKLPPSRLSYRHSLMLVRSFLLSAWLASPGVLSARLEALHNDIALLVLPPRRQRKFPRAVRVKNTHYPKKRPLQ